MKDSCTVFLFPFHPRWRSAFQHVLLTLPACPSRCWIPCQRRSVFLPENGKSAGWQPFGIFSDFRNTSLKPIDSTGKNAAACHTVSSAFGFKNSHSLPQWEGGAEVATLGQVPFDTTQMFFSLSLMLSSLFHLHSCKLGFKWCHC